MSYSLHDFNYTLPDELIAQFPAKNRAESRLLVAPAHSDELIHTQFPAFLDYINENDLIVFNDTRVMNARLFGKKISGGKIECLIERVLNGHEALAHIRASITPKINTEIIFENKLHAKVIARENEFFILKFLNHETISALLEKYGHLPLPPYIARDVKREDFERYQTIYAEKLGAVAAPTAGLHFDKNIFSKLKNKKIEMGFVTLHVGAGTFQPVRGDDLSQHKMHHEFFIITEKLCEQIYATRERGGRVIAIGTTVVRALESAGISREIKSFSGETNIFITPGFQFKMVDMLLTNFHLPKSTLLMLVSAFAGFDKIKLIYKNAVEKQYRFFSYGDAMLLYCAHAYARAHNHLHFHHYSISSKILTNFIRRPTMSYQHVKTPSHGEKIKVDAQHKLHVPNQPIIPFIEGDGIGVDITPVMKQVVDAAVKKVYGDVKKIHWMEIYAGEKAVKIYGNNTWLPQETFQAAKEFVVSIKGPLTTPVGGGIRSLNVALRQELDLYVCLRPVRYFEGTPSPVKHPEKVNMVIFRENSEDIYAGIEWESNSADVKKLISFLQTEMHVKKIRFPETSAIGIKPVSKHGTQRLVRRAIQYAIDNNRDSVTLVHKGNIMKFTEGGFRDWGYALARDEFGAQLIDQGPWMKFKNPKTEKDIVMKDVIADAFLQQILLRPEDYSVIATLNLNGDYISDALAAQVGGIGIAPGANLSDNVAIFEATHGTAPKYAGKNKVNPGSIILSAEMMLRYMGWIEAADLIIKGVNGAIQSKTVTYDLARLMHGAHEVSCSGFGDAIIQKM